MAKINANSRFALAPSIGNIPRSRFVRDQKTVTSFNVSECVPFFLDEVLPGDSFTVDTSKVVRLQTLLTPIFDDIYLDTYYFYVPSRLTWTHWKEFMGENNESAWIPETEYSIPQITSPESTGWNVGTIADYFGLPTGVPNLSVSALPFRAYALIMNHFFRSEALTDPLNIPLDDSNQTGTNGSSYVNDVANGGTPFLAAKFHDYFTSALPSPQRGPSVSIDLAGLNADTIPVFGNGNTLGLYDGVNNVGLGTTHQSYNSMYLGGSASVIYGVPAGTETSTYSGSSAYKSLGVVTKAQAGDNPEYSGLIGDVSGLSTSDVISISQFRTAVAIQQFYESLARHGSRYGEILKGEFSVNSPDSRLQDPEYLGGNRIALNISQSIQTSETGTTPQGNTTGYSVTADTHSDFTHSFVEHGFIIGVMVARYKHTYQQGIERMWSRKTRFQYYWPKLANLSEQPILNKEIYAQGSAVVDSSNNVVDDKVFGYQECWADYRYKPSKVTGMMRSTYSQSLDIWHLADDYDSLPGLSDNWIREDNTTVDRVLAVSSNLSDQIMADIYVKNITTRPMPVYSIPGLTRL